MQPITSELRSRQLQSSCKSEKVFKNKTDESSVLGDFEVIAFLDFLLSKATLSDFTV